MFICEEGVVLEVGFVWVWLVSCVEVCVYFLGRFGRVIWIGSLVLFCCISYCFFWNVVGGYFIGLLGSLEEKKDRK